MIKLFEANEKQFLNNGLGTLRPLKCIETKKKSLNGWFVECEFFIKDKDKIKQDMILFVCTKEKGGQPFRCNNINYTDRKITVTANHVIFDAERLLLDDVRPTNLAPVSFLKWINERTDNISPFSLSSDVSGSGTKYFIRKTLLDAFKETEELFGGSFDADKFDIRLKAQIGNDDGFSVAYGKNIQSVSVIEDWSAVATKIMPIGPSELLLPEKYISTEIQYEQPYTKVIEFDFDTSYENAEGEKVDYTEDEKIIILRKLAIEYAKDCYIPKINYVVKSDVPQTLRIGDIVHVKHPIITINTEVQSYTYNTITKRVLTLEFGNYERDVKKVFDSLKEKIEEANKNSSSALKESEKQTDLINQLNKKGLVYIDENEILILDKLPKESAEQVWRLGLGGLGFSSNGYKGPFEYALTQDGHFNIDFIQANSITVNKLAADVGSSLDLSSNQTINLIVADVKEQTNSLTLKVDGLLNQITTIGGNNLIKDSLGVFGGSWISTNDKKYSLNTSIDVKRRNLIGIAILLNADTITQTITLPDGEYTLSFSYCKHVSLAVVKLKINEQEFDLTNTEYTEFKYSFILNSGSIQIQFISDTLDSCTIVNLMLNQGSVASLWSLSQGEAYSDNFQISKDGATVSSSASDVFFNMKNDIIGFKNKNTGEYITNFTDVGIDVKEINVKDKSKIAGLLIQEIETKSGIQTVFNRIGR